MNDQEKKVKRYLAGRRMVHPTTFFHFHPSQLVLRRRKMVGKLYPKADGPYRVKEVRGKYVQRVTIELVEGSAGRKPLLVHASQLTPYLKPYVEPDAIEWDEEEPEQEE